MKNKELKEKKIIFTKEIDDKIARIAIIFTFIAIGIILLVSPNYFGSEVATKIVRWIFIVFGALGLMSEIFRSKQTDIKGFNNLFVGIFLIAAWILEYLCLNIWWINIFAIITLIIGAFALIKGLLEIFYSSYLHIKDKKSIWAEIFGQITKIAAFILLILQILNAISK